MDVSTAIKLRLAIQWWCECRNYIVFCISKLAPRSVLDVLLALQGRTDIAFGFFKRLAQHIVPNVSMLTKRRHECPSYIVFYISQV